MNRPTSKALLKWWDEQPKGDRTCSDCGKTGPGHLVQPQHPFYAGGKENVAWCSNCTNERIHKAREKRKAQLADEPRCEVENCKRRGNWKSFGVLLCGRHLQRAQRAHQKNLGGAGFLGMFEAPAYSRTVLLEMAKRGALTGG
ncbi:hypothetical protein LCGC14_1369620 [marine sediment metagenome]|uniref:Uncharacterized protein n=1 Tax=marine sediment metagenome TaxID=412755 RepID=A0A0F9K5W4_9ZZZZ